MDLELFEGEGKTVTVTFTDEVTGAAVDLTGATLSAAVRSDIYSATSLLTIIDASFNKANIATGIVTFTLSTTDIGTTMIAGTYVIQVKAAFSTTNTDISKYLTLWVKEAIV